MRLWNYVVGTPEDAKIEMRFSKLFEGYDITGSPALVHPKDIDRMFISLVPPGFSASSSDLLQNRIDAWGRTQRNRLRMVSEPCSRSATSSFRRTV